MAAWAACHSLWVRSPSSSASCCRSCCNWASSWGSWVSSASSRVWVVARSWVFFDRCDRPSWCCCVNRWISFCSCSALSWHSRYCCLASASSREWSLSSLAHRSMLESHLSRISAIWVKRSRNPATSADSPSSALPKCNWELLPRFAPPVIAPLVSSNSPSRVTMRVRPNTCRALSRVSKTTVPPKT